MPVNPAALVPLLVLAVAFLVYCYVDLVRTGSTRYLPKWAWGIVCTVSIPLGGIVYLVLGRGKRDARG